MNRVDRPHDSDMKTPLPTPCTGVCAIGDDGLCEGCLRTIDEIAGWAVMGDDERSSLMLELATRVRTG
jgi:predicted Fe-S protein YdhL (DUF1289 family)